MLEKKKRNIEVCLRQEKELKKQIENMSKKEIAEITKLKEDIEKIKLVERKEENQKRVNELETDLKKINGQI